MIDIPWKSSVLRCFDDPEHCYICKFVAGDRTPEVMLKVIQQMDTALAEAEHGERLAIERLSGLLVLDAEHAEQVLDVDWLQMGGESQG